MVPVVLSVFDLCSLFVSYFLTFVFLSPAQRIIWSSDRVWCLAFIAWIPAGLRLMHRSRYRALKMERTASDAVNATGCHALVFIALMYLTATVGPDWQTLCVFYAVSLVMLPTARTVARTLLKIVRSKGRNYSKVVIVGMNDTALRLCDQLCADPGFGYKVLAFFNETPCASAPANLYCGTIDELDSYVRQHKVDEIFCTLPGERQEALRTTIAAADNNTAQYYYVPQLNRYIARGFGINTLGSMPVMPIESPPLSYFPARMAKRTLDIAVSLTAAFLFPLVFIPVAILIKISSKGPVFYKQKRTGYKGKPFNCLKFRTMRYDPADEAPVEKNDPRVTAIGRFLRHSSLDELPQIFNVLAGHMSIVGPRPHMVSHTEYYRPLIDKYMLRHSVKPGITGWAQVNGYRGTTDYLWKMERRVEHDVWYIENWSFMLDLKIIARTLLKILRGDDNAY